MTGTLLEVQDLHTHFATDKGIVKAVDGVSFEIAEGGILGLVGESGSGKSVTGLSILRMLPSRKGRIAGGSILFDGEDLLGKPDGEMQSYRGNKISMVFQSAMTALDPFYRVGDQLSEVIRLHQNLDRKRARTEAVSALELVGIPDPGQRYRSYPHELSGGQRQRVVIALALACKPRLLIADEPTTALDATIQKQIIELLMKVNRELGTSILMITHDFGVVAEMCQTVAVMYAGKIVEYADTRTMLGDPEHPYTRGLISSVPRVGHRMREAPPDASPRGRSRLFQIPGTAPSGAGDDSGCSFAPRCAGAMARCFDADPPRVAFRDGHWADCHARQVEQQEEVSA